MLRLNLSSIAGCLRENLKIAGLRSDSMRGMGTNMCFFVDLSQRRDFMPTLVKNVLTFIQDCFLLKQNPPEKKGGHCLLITVFCCSSVSCLLFLF